MAEDWAANVKKYVPDADDDIIAGIVRYCGIALQKRDSSLVSFTDPAETGRVRENFLKKKLGLTDPDADLDAAIAGVGEKMKGENFRNRVTVYYLLADHFADLCDGDIPRGPHVMEITRLCLPARLGREDRRAVRNRLISAMVDHTLQCGVSVLIGVVTAVFRETILAMGWRAAPLGPARSHQGGSIGAFRVDLDPATPGLLAATGIYVPDTIAPVAAEAA